MGGATSDHWGYPLEIGSAAVVELSELTAAAAPAREPLTLNLSAEDRAAYAALAEWGRARAAEYGGSEDQAEELAAEAMLALEAADEQLAELRRELELERAARELAERLAERRAREIHRLESELAQLRRGFRETYSREGGS